VEPAALDGGEPSADGDTMTKKQAEPTITKPAVNSAAELSEKELSQASGGAVDMFIPAEKQGTHIWVDKAGITDGTKGIVKKP
jgi:hypothetical protein